LIQKSVGLEKEWISYIRDKIGTSRYNEVDSSLTIETTPFKSTQMQDIIATFDNNFKRKDGKL